MQNLRVYNDLDETVAITAFCSGVQHVKCAASFHRKRPATLVELSERVEKYIDTEEFLKTKDLNASDEGPTWGKRRHDGPHRGTGKKQKPGQQRGCQNQVPMALTLLSRSISEVMAATEAHNLLKQLNKMKSPPEK